MPIPDSRDDMRRYTHSITGHMRHPLIVKALLSNVVTLEEVRAAEHTGVAIAAAYPDEVTA